jgi:hypothetical protein
VVHGTAQHRGRGCSDNQTANLWRAAYGAQTKAIEEEEGRGEKLTATISEWPGAGEGCEGSGVTHAFRVHKCRALLPPAGGVDSLPRSHHRLGRTVTNCGSNRC